MGADIQFNNPVEAGVFTARRLDAVGIPAGLFGGAAIAYLQLWEKTYKTPRACKDFDMVIPKPFMKEAARELLMAGVKARTLQSLITDDSMLQLIVGKWKGELFSDPLAFNQVIKLGSRLVVGKVTISIGDLLLTKLQIHEPSIADIKDIVAMVYSFGESHRLLFDDATSRVQEVCDENWRLHYAANRSINKALLCLPEVANPAVVVVVKKRLYDLRESLLDSPKTLTWKLRELVGPKWRWYDDVDAPPADRSIL